MKQPAHPIAVITDSVAQVPADLAEQLGITVIPFIVTIEGKSYLDGVDLQPTELYRRMRVEKIVPSTSAPPPTKYQEVFSQLLEDGTQAILCITLASKLSSAYNTACIAAQQALAEFPGRVIEIFDSKLATLSEGFIAIAAARAASEGKSFEAVLQAAKTVYQSAGLVAMLDTLEYLARGGRIGRLTYLAGSLIKIHPVLKIDTDGMLSPISRVRTDLHAMQTMVDHVASQREGQKILYLAILEADASEQATKLRLMALEKLHPDQVYYSQLTPVMGAHTGPGVIGLSYYYE